MSSSSLSKVIMDPPATQRGRAQIVPKQKEDDGENKIFPAKASRRTPSFSTSSSSSSSLSSRSSSLGSLYFPDESPLSPATPLKFSGVPFSWETLPGIPKKNIHIKKESLLKKQLPLPPTATPHPLISSKKSCFQEFGTWKKDSPENFRKDPFIAALVECSKDDDDDVHDDDDDDDDDQDSSYRSFFINGAKVTRSISDRFGFTSLYTSCKNTCAVSDSLVYTPRSTRTSYDLIHHHHHHHNHHRRRRGTC